MALAIFDLDGTLIDSMGVWEAAPALTLKELGKAPEENVADIFREKGYRDTAKWMVEHYGLDKDYHEILKMMDKSVIPAYRDGIELKEGAREYLEKLRKKGVKTCILTANHPELLEMTMAHHELSDLVNAWWPASHFNMKKSDPRIFSLVAKEMDEDLSSCLLFEDSAYAVESAELAGLSSVGVLEKEESEENKKLRESCIRCISSFTELMEKDVF